MGVFDLFINLFNDCIPAGGESLLADEILRTLAALNPRLEVERIYILGETVIEKSEDVERVVRLFLDGGCSALMGLPPIDVTKDFLQLIYVESRDSKGWVIIIVDPFELYLNSYVARDLGEMWVDLSRCEARMIYPVNP